MILGATVIGLLACAAPARAQDCAGGAAEQDQSYSSGTSGMWKIGAWTVRQSPNPERPPCAGTETEAWIDQPFFCYSSYMVNGRCDSYNYWNDTFAGAAAPGCGDIYGHSMHFLRLPGLDIWIEHGPTSTNLHTTCDPYNPCDEPWADPQTCGGSPIVIAINKRRDYQLTSAFDGVSFDLNGDGVAEPIAWTMAGDDVAFLAIDRDGDGKITSGKELFGNFTVPGVENGFAALQSLNLALNGNVRVGSIDADQPLFAKLLLWTDRNHNGVSEPSELQPFGDLFAAIQPAWRLSNRRDGHGNVYRYQGTVFVRTGSGRNYPLSPEAVQSRAVTVYDVFFAGR
jgi:hypothetical protein